MMREIAEIHVKALPHTFSSKRGVGFVAFLYKIVSYLGFVETVSKNGKIVGVISGIGSLILTLAVEPNWQHMGIGSELVKARKGKLFVYTQEPSAGFYLKLGFEKIFTLGRTIFLWRK